MLNQKQVKKAIDLEISEEELIIVTESLNNLVEIVISSIKKFPEGKRVIPVQDLNEFVSMMFRNMVNIPKGFRRKTINRIKRLNNKVVHNLVINNTFLKRFIENPITAIKEFQLKEIE